MGDEGWQVFIAYPSPERASADELYGQLVRAGIQVFLDHVALRPGDPWTAKISAAQRQACVTVVLVSGVTERAFYENEEIAQAIALSRKDPERHRVVPVYLDDRADPPYGLRCIQPLRTFEVGGMAGIAIAVLSLLRLGESTAKGSMLLPGAARARPTPPLRSPFRPGMPLYAGDYLCTSRQDLLNTMLADLSNCTNVNLVGERRTGRTSMLNYLHSHLLADAKQVVARVNLQDDVITDSHFYGTMLWGIGQCPLGEETIGADRVRTLEDRQVADYREVRRVLRLLREDATTVVLLDEFERCFEASEGFPFPHFFDNLRSLLGGDHHGPYAKAVVATRRPLAKYFLSRQVTSTLPSYLPVRQLELLTDGDVEHVLAQESPHRLGPGQREHAALLADRHPCRVQSAGEAWYRTLEQNHSQKWAEAEFMRLSEQTCLGATPHDPGSMEG